MDSGRSAIQWILEKDREQTNDAGIRNPEGYKRIWLPVYNCPLVADRIKRVTSLDYRWYNLREDFYPDIPEAELGDKDILLWVNYFGAALDQVIDNVVALKLKTGCEIILDNIHAYFATPRMDVINIYSCRKFLGVPDGGHIIGNSICPRLLPVYPTAVNYTYLLKAAESGADSAYEGYRASERRFKEADRAYGMPLLTRKVLGILNYQEIIASRKRNFDTLHRILGPSNRFTANSSRGDDCYAGTVNFNSCTPSVYPYVTSDKELRESLIYNKVFVSRFWKHVLSNDRASLFEKNLAEYLIPLPIDQRYSPADMENLGQIVKEMER